MHYATRNQGIIYAATLPLCRSVCRHNRAGPTCPARRSQRRAEAATEAFWAAVNTALGSPVGAPYANCAVYSPATYWLGTTVRAEIKLASSPNVAVLTTLLISVRS